MIKKDADWRPNSMQNFTSSRCCGRRLDSITCLRINRIYSTLISFSLLSISIILALTGFVCTHKIQAEEECLSSNVICYECDSRYDPNCADPFDFSYTATLEPASQPTVPKASTNETTTNSNNLLDNNRKAGSFPSPSEQIIAAPNETSSTTIPQSRQPKKLPATSYCHGCCVKITSKLIDGSVFVKRTCTTNLQINYFMVGLVCMKESGDRGKMCFCETDYCNGTPAISPTKLVLIITSLAIINVILHPKASIMRYH